MRLTISTTFAYYLPIFAILLGVLSPPVAVGKSMTIEINDYGPTREEAERRVLLNAVRDGLTRFMNEQAKHPSMTERILKRLNAIQADHYRPLVKRWRLDLDDANQGQHYLEGKVTLDVDVLKLWADEWLRQLSAEGKTQRAPIKHRLSLFIAREALEEADLAAEDRALRKPFMHALEQRLISSGYEIKREEQKRQAQYVLQLSQSSLDRHGLSGSVNFTVEVFENRADGSLVTTADGYAAASLTTTSAALRKELLQRAAVKVAAELQRKFEHLAVAKQTVELVFFAPQDISKRRARHDLLEGLAAIYGLTSDADIDTFDEAVNLQITEESDHYTFSFLVPDDYHVRPTQLERGLIDLHQQVLHSTEAEVSLAAGGKKWNIFDATARPALLGPKPTTAQWTVDIERLLQAGKLDSPLGIGKNVLDTVRSRLAKDPNAAEALAYLSRLSSAFVSQAHEEMDKAQWGAAGRTLNRAERVLNDHPSLAAARTELQKARDALQQQIQQSPPPAAEPSSPTQKASQRPEPSTPRVVFPTLESFARSAPRVVQTLDIPGLAADVDGIWEVTVNGQAVDFAPANDQDQRFLDAPGAPTQAFRVPYTPGQDTTIEVVVSDTRRQQERRTLIVQAGKVTIQVPNEVQDGREILEPDHYWALLFGNQNYSEGLDSLKTPHKDVDELAAVLINQYAFDPKHVFVLKDATRQTMLTALYALHEQVKGNDSLLIFYAGHGHQEKGFGGKGFWIPVDGLSRHAKNQHILSSWVPNSLVHDILEASRARHVLLISDSCYSGSFKTRSIGERRAFAANAAFFYGLATKTSRRAITSGDLEPVADGGAPGHSIFAYHLINTLRQASSAINGERLFQLLVDPVTQKSNQTPQYFTVQGAGDQGGDFVFVPKRSTTP